MEEDILNYSPTVIFRGTCPEHEYKARAIQSNIGNFNFF